MSLPIDFYRLPFHPPLSLSSPPPPQTDRRRERENDEEERASKKLKTSDFSEDDANLKQCSICYEHITDSETCQNGHPTCESCYVNWNKRCYASREETTCPICREPFEDLEIDMANMRLKEFIVSKEGRFRISELILEGNNLMDWTPFNKMPCLRRLYLQYGMSFQAPPIPSGTFSSLSMLVHLNLAGNSLKEIRRDMFSGLSNLSLLNLSSTWLSALPEDVFDDLRSLHVLSLTHNSIKTLPPNVFRNLGALTELNLCSNKLKALESPFSGLSSLISLYLSENDLENVNVRTFAGLSKLKYLTMGRNWISELPVGIFDDLVSLVKLLLGSCFRLAGIPDGLFSKLGKVSHLDLLDARAKTLHVTKKTLEGLHSLESVYFVGNDMDFAVGCFDDKPYLQSLILQCLSLTSLPVGLFHGLYKVNYIYLGNNMIKRLEVGVFDELPELRRLILKNNYLQKLPEKVFEKMKNLSELDLSFNPLETFSVDLIDGLNQLEKCHLPGLDRNLERDIRVLLRNNKRK